MIGNTKRTLIFLSIVFLLSSGRVYATCSPEHSTPEESHPEEPQEPKEPLIPQGPGYGSGGVYYVPETTPMIPRTLIEKLKTKPKGEPTAPPDSDPKITPKEPEEPTPSSAPEETPEGGCCCFKIITFRNTTRLPVRFSTTGPRNPYEVRAGETFVVREEAECIRISFWYPDPSRNWGFAGQTRLCCEDLQPGPVRGFPGLEVVSFETKRCPPEKCEETERETPGGSAPPEEPSRPIPPSTPEEPEEPTPPSTPEEPIPPSTPEEPEEPPLYPGYTTCHCQFNGMGWLIWKSIDAQYIYIPQPRRDYKIPLRGTVELKALATDEDIGIVSSVRYVDGEIDCYGKANVHALNALDYAWKITQGEGTFKNGRKRQVGESVIYIPPINLPVGEHIVKIRTEVDDVAGKGDDDKNTGEIYMKIKRLRDDLEHYYIDFDIKEFAPASVGPEPAIPDCPCEVTTEWVDASPMAHSMIKPDGSEDICVNCTDIWVADRNDVDKLLILCKDRDPRCAEDEASKDINDVVIHNWFADNGTYLGTNVGQKVIYKAPARVPPGPVPNERIELKSRDSGMQFADKPPPKEEKKITIHSADIDINTNKKARNREGIPIASRPLHINDADEENELKPGGYIWVNDDNDHQEMPDSKIDKDENNYVGENDLEPIRVDISDSVWEKRLTVELEVEPIEGAVGDIKIWQDIKKERPVALAGGKATFTRKEDLDRDNDKILYVEGIDKGIFRIYLRVKDGGEIVCEDIIKLYVYAVVSLQWESHEQTAVTRDSPPAPTGQRRDGKRIFPDKHNLADARAHDRPKLRAIIRPTIPADSGWNLPLYVRVWDVDHYHSSTDFDPNGANLPMDNRTGYTSSSETGDAYNIGIEVVDNSVTRVIEETDSRLRWAEKIEGKEDPTEDAILDITHHTPCSNWRAAAGMGDNMHTAVRINNDPADGATLEYRNNTALNIAAVSGQGNTTTQSTETLTVWRKLYIEQDLMRNFDSSEGPENVRSVRAAQVLSRGVSGGQNFVRVNIGFGQVGQFQNGRAAFLGLDRFGAPTVNLGTRTIRRNTTGASPNRVYLTAAAPAASNIVILYDDDVNPTNLNSPAPHVQPASPPVTLFNHPGGFPAACIEADFAALDSLDTNNAAFDLNMQNHFTNLSAVKGTRGGRRFWVATVLGGYQYQVADSFDPNSSVTRGISAPYWHGPTTATACGGTVTFYEAIRDQTTNWQQGVADTRNTRLQRTTVHEVGHVMGGQHTDGGLMAGGVGTNPGNGMFSPTTLKRFMLIHDEGPGHK